MGKTFCRQKTDKEWKNRNKIYYHIAITRLGVRFYASRCGNHQQDEQAQTFSELTDEEIIETASMVQLSKKSRTEECFSSDSEDEDEPDITDQEVLKSLFMARKYAQKKGLSKEVFFSLSKMEQSVSQDMMEKRSSPISQNISKNNF